MSGSINEGASTSAGLTGAINEGASTSAGLTGAINEGASTSACLSGVSTSANLSEYELLRQENMNKLQQEVGDVFNNALQCAQKLNKKFQFRSGRRPAHRPGRRVKLFSKLEKSSNVKKETQGEDIRRSLRDKRKQIYYNSKEEDDKGKNKKRRQRNNYQKKFPLSKSEGSKRKFSRKVSRLDVSLVTKEMLDNIIYRSVGKKYSTNEGTTCHQCRQKTLDQKSYCRHESCKGMRGMFCGFCLGTRYGEDVAEALLNPLWACPPCRGRCNCSICRRDQGKDPTGQLAQVAKAKGYKSVCHLLRTIEEEQDSTNKNSIDKCELKNPVENNIETGNQSKIDNLNEKVVFNEYNAKNKFGQIKSKKNDNCCIKDEEICSSKNNIKEPKESSEMIIDQIYEQFMSSKLLKEEN
ncbi:cell division cycle-associated protein 7-like [Rhopalosiphum maidis]|uniref:cell division cycle-associated protein 7-like n=1 Tax=Rhopalosiphum maidis TaxID=43146 RepID=UPI000EFDC2F4|nr:cell division cycle-associated protein 7-like [Rhopalosiphum maidis]